MRNLKTFSLIFFLLSSPAWAGGPLTVNEDGNAIVWDNSGAIDLHPETGTCATIANSIMIDRLSDNLNFWTGIDGIELSFDIVEDVIDDDVEGVEADDYLVDDADDPGLNDDINPILFDDDGSIVSTYFGEGNEFAILGFAGPDGFSSDLTEIVDGQAVFNCLCLETNELFEDCEAEGVVFTDDDLDFTMVHEIGHFLGIDHTQVNQNLAEGGNCDIEETGDCDDIPTMYPLSVDAGDQISLSRDDEVIALTLYGTDSFSDNFCTVTGVLLDVDGNDLRCADVQLVTDDITDTIAQVSGVFAQASDDDGDGYTDGDGECLDDCGRFTIHGLEPGTTYTINIKPIDDSWVGASGIGPCSTQNDGIEAQEEIATVEDCSGGDVQDLGEIETTSVAATAGEDSGGDGDSGAEDDGTTEDECGVDKDFSTCSSIASCSLSKRQEPSSSIGAFAPFLFLLSIMVIRGHRLASSRISA